MRSLAVMNIDCIQYLTKVMTGDRDDIYITLISAAMGKVRPFCRSGLKTNTLRPYCGLLSENFGQKSGQKS